jgi:methylisocitrate lyase
MTVRKKLKAIMAGKKLVLMPGAYDALSARVIEAEGFEAIVAGGYAGVGSMLAQADMGQSNMRDYASHYGRICDAVEIPVYVDADTGFGGVNNVRQMVHAFEAAGVAGLFISDQVFPNRCGYLPGKQIVPVEQMLAKLKAALDARRDPELFIAGAHRRRRRRGPRAGDRALPAVHGSRRRHGQADGPRHHSRRSSGAARDSRARTWRRCRRRRARRRAACPSWKPPGSALRPSRRSRCSRRRTAVRNVLRLLKKSDSLAPCQEHLIPLDDYYGLVGLKDLLAREESYDKAAAALVQKRAAE